MSDNDMFDVDEEGGAEEQQKQGKKKIGFIPAVVIDILKWTAIIIAAVIFIVVVTVITVRTVTKGSQAAPQRIPLASEYQDDSARLLEWYGQLGEIRGTTRDEVRKTYIVAPFVGYEPEDEAASQELIRRNVQLKEVISIYFSSRTLAELEGVENRQRVKRELREAINKIMTNDIVEVAFDRYEFIEF